MTERDECRRRIVDLVMEMLKGLDGRHWERVIAAAGEIERIAGELKQADETDKELW
jgi:alkylated DNA nucleotide flippase Atl1